MMVLFHLARVYDKLCSSEVPWHVLGRSNGTPRSGLIAHPTSPIIHEKDSLSQNGTKAMGKSPVDGWLG
jgi:hypothetical protein